MSRQMWKDYYSDIREGYHNMTTHNYMKSIRDFWTDFDNAYLNKDILRMKYVMFQIEDALERSSLSSYTWELYEALNKMGELIPKYEELWNENKN